MTYDPDTGWDNVPRQIHSDSPYDADPPVHRTMEQREAEEKDAEHYTD
jgi:hypothetical protein